MATFKHDEKFNPGKIRLISLISFFMGFLQAFFIYVMSTYFKQAAGTENVGVFYLVGYAVTLVCFLYLHKIIRKFGKSDVLYFALFCKIITITALLFSPFPWLSVALVIAYIIFGNLEWVSLDIILESYSKDSFSGRIRGKYLTIMNAGFLLAPFLSVHVLDNYDFYGVFFVLLMFNVFVFFVATLGIGRVNHSFRRNLTITEVVKKVLRRKDIRGILYVSFALEFFYSLMVIYTPIYLSNLGFSWKEIGIIFTAMLLPFVLLQYPVGVLADKKIGEKELLIFSISLMGLSAFSISLISSGTVLVWSIILFMTRIGASLIEILRDSYFYKRVDGHDVDIINIFRTARPVAYILASLASALLLVAFPMKYVFVLISAVVLLALYPAARLIDNKSEGETG